MRSTIKIKIKSIAVAMLIMTVALWTISSSYSAAFPRDNITISASGAWGQFNTKRIVIERYININTGQIFWHYATRDKINNSPSGTIELGYKVLPKISADVGVSYLWGKSRISTKAQAFMDNYYNWQISDDYWFSASLWAPYIEGEYSIRAAPVNISLSCGLAWLLGDANLPVYSDTSHVIPPNLPPIIRVHKKANGIGGIFSLGAAYNLSTYFSPRLELGYRILKTEKLDTGSIDFQVKHIDFSGFFVGAGFSLQL